MAKVCFFGMDSAFSVRALRALLASPQEIVAVVRPKGGRETRREQTCVRERAPRGRRSLDDDTADLARVAHAHGVPLFTVGDASQESVVRVVRDARAERGAIAFFNQLLRPALLDALPGGVVNAHPSLLPLLRGPAPLFWTYREQHEESGLTVHRVTPREDDGDVVAQERMPLAFGTPGEHHVRALGERVGPLLARALAALDDGSASPAPQDPARATRAPRPTERDLVVDRALGARRIFHFVRGFGRFQPLVVELGDARCRVIDAIDLDTEREVPGGDHAIVGDALLLACRPGVVVLRIDPAQPA